MLEVAGRLGALFQRSISNGSATGLWSVEAEMNVNSALSLANRYPADGFIASRESSGKCIEPACTGIQHAARDVLSLRIALFGGALADVDLISEQILLHRNRLIKDHFIIGISCKGINAFDSTS